MLTVAPASLDRLFRPRSIAVFGGREAAEVVAQCDKFGFDGAIWPVHPKRDEVLGRPVYRHVEDLPDAPDAAFIGVNRDLTIDIVRRLSARGAGGAVCYASGFRESMHEIEGGDALEADLVIAAGAMPIVGPNCYGFVNAIDGALLWPDQHGLERTTGGVAILSQSSNVAINLSMQQRGLPIAYLMTVGNQAQTGMSHLIDGLLDDDRVTAIGLYLEGLDDARAVEEAALKAREKRVPIVVLKAGRSEQAQAATLSHTASLAGSDAAADAFFHRLGIARTASLPSFLETLKLLHATGPLPGNRISSMSCSGGEASIMADSAVGRDVVFKPLTDGDRARVKETLGPLVSVANPLDYHTFIWADRARMTATFSAMMTARFDVTLLILDIPRADRCDDTDWRVTLDAYADAARQTDSRAAIVASLPENLPEDWSHRILEAGLVALHGFDEALMAVEHAAHIGSRWQADPAGRLLIWPRPDGPATTLDEAEAKALLSGFDIPLPARRVVTDADAAVQAGAEIGHPVVVKALGLAHKSEHDAVRLGLSSDAAIVAAATDLLALGDRLLVEEMVTDAVAELIVGVTHDPQYGLLLTVGAGGVLVELLKDTATLLLPARQDEIRAALMSLRTAPVLTGYRGRPAGDMDAVIAAIGAIAHFAEEQADRLIELDVNPLMVRPAKRDDGPGAVAVDALIRVKTLD